MRAAVDLASPQEIVTYLTACAERHEGRSVAGISAPYASAMAGDKNLRKDFLSMDVLVPDGKGFVWGARTLGVPCGDRIAIPDLCERLLSEGNARGWKVFLYGSTEELNAKALENLRARFPNLAAVEGLNGYNQNQETENALIEKLRSEQFNLLIVARPSPDKEKFLSRCCKAAGVVGLAAGGYADILAGAKKRAPQVVQSLGMEWSWRLLQDPRHLWKRIGWANAKFATAVIWNKILGVPRRPFYAIPTLHVLAIITITILAYAGSLNAPYHFDDPEYIQRNTAIRSFSSLKDITVTAHRKIWWLSNAICYKLSEKLGQHEPNTPDPKIFGVWTIHHQPDKPEVSIFRVWNIGCQIIAALALYGLLRRVLRAAKNVDGKADDSRFDLRPFAAAAIFAGHPLCTEAVTYISGRDNGMGGMFYLLGLYFAAISFEWMGFGAARASQPAQSAKLTWPHWIWPALGMIAMGGCAVLTKESHLTFPGAVALTYFCFYRRGPAPSVGIGTLMGLIGAVAVLGWGAAGRADGRIWIAVPWAMFVLGAGALWSGRAEGARIGKLSAGWAFLFVAIGLGAAAILAFPYSYTRILDALTGYQGSSYVRSLCSQAYAVPRMLLKAVFPLQLSFDHGFNLTHTLNIDHEFPTISDPHDPRVFWNAAIILGLFVFGIVGAWRGWLAGFGVLLALIVIAPTNTVIERGDIVSERNFYLVAAGGACVLAWVAGGIANFFAMKFVKPGDDRKKQESMRWEGALWTILIACCAAGPFVSFTSLRNGEWNNPRRLWESSLERSPNKMRVLYNYGVSMQALKRYEEAETAFNRAIQLGEEMSLRGQFRPDEAVDVKCFHLAYSRLADIHLQRYINSNREDGKPIADIRAIYEKGLNRTAFDPDLAYSYANFLINIGQAASTVQILMQSYNLHTWADQLFLPLGVGNLESGDYAQAQHWLQKALLIKDEHSLGFAYKMPDEDRARILFILGIARSRMKLTDLTRSTFSEALRLDPQQVLPVLMGVNAVRNLKLTEINTNDQLLKAISVTRRDILVALRDASKEIIDSKVPGNFPNMEEYRKLFDDEIKRRDEHQKRRIEMGFKDDPEIDD